MLSRICWNIEHLSSICRYTLFWCLCFFRTWWRRLCMTSLTTRSSTSSSVFTGRPPCLYPRSATVVIMLKPRLGRVIVLPFEKRWHIGIALSFSLSVRRSVSLSVGRSVGPSQRIKLGYTIAFIKISNCIAYQVMTTQQVFNWTHI